MPNAFVLMPFAKEFDDIYDHFIKPVLEDAGFEVARADESKGQDNIPRDIIKGIAWAELIVADFTGGNANVAYELGVAHKEGKPDIRITQSIDDVPSDLKSYRVLKYDLNFPEIEEAKDKLTMLAADFLAEIAEFQNPVSDFWPHGESKKVGGQGLNNYLKEIHDSCNRITDDISKDVQALDDHGKGVSKHITGLSISQDNVVRHLCNSFAERISEFKSGFQKYSEDFKKSTANPEGNLEFVISHHLGDNRESNSAIEFLKASLLANHGRLILLASRLENIPINMYMLGFAGQKFFLMKVCEEASATIRVFAENIDNTIISISRTLEKYA